ncbi:uncharacterized protein OCT59_001439 [Rhizophagus irregularis]|uniref:uncharacterized protein n=1 Tax=Rhizophagus irregularis TaxID=588596 RepID=UPI003323C0C1|nr:hypothetical protein OCT59_001439 [Rhizophagus irregularis]
MNRSVSNNKHNNSVRRKPRSNSDEFETYDGPMRNIVDSRGGTLIKPAECFARSLRKMMDQAGLFAQQNR